MFTHLDDKDNPQIVDVSAKDVSLRTAHARTRMHLPPEVAAALEGNEIRTKKGPVFQTAIIAGVMASKKTSELIPLCHPIPLEDCKIEISAAGSEVIIDCRTKTHHKTGVEMEALTGASVAALTIYDMCKGMSHDIVIGETVLVSKTGGKRDFNRESSA